MRRIKFILWFVLLGVTTVISATPVALHPFKDAQLRQRYDSLTQQIRCLVCQNETIASSNAKLAAQLRQEVSVLLKQGESDQAIKQYFVARYGDFVLFDPPVTRSTLVLWYGPLILLVVAAAVFAVVVRRYRLQKKLGVKS